MARDTEDYNWLDDPFDEKKAAREQQETGMTGRSKLFVGIGCLAVVIAIGLMGFLGLGLIGAIAA